MSLQHKPSYLTVANCLAEAHILKKRGQLTSARLLVNEQIKKHPHNEALHMMHDKIAHAQKIKETMTVKTSILKSKAITPRPHLRPR